MATALILSALAMTLIVGARYLLKLHHEKYRCNYGLYFRHWDRLCGTDRGLGSFAAAGDPSGCGAQSKLVTPTGIEPVFQP